MGSRWCCELHLHPEGIEVRGLSCCPPQLLCFFMLSTWRKGVTLEAECEHPFEMLWCGRAHAALPVLNGLLADAKEPTQCSLGQAHALAQPHTGAPEGVLPFVLIGRQMLHLNFPVSSSCAVC